MELLTSMLATPPSFTSIVTFGDSLSDAGNFRSLCSGGQNLGFQDSRGVWSNGPLMATHLASLLGIDPASTGSHLFGGTNHAYSSSGITQGWRACINGSSEQYVGDIGDFGEDQQVQNSKGLQTAIDDYLAANPDLHGNGALYVMLSGANDLLAFFDHQLGSKLIDPAILEPFGGDVTKWLTAQPLAKIALAERLVAAGASTVLILNLPDIAVIPKSAATPAAMLPVITAQSERHNALLKAGIAASPHKRSMPLFDLFAFVNALISDPANYGLTEVVAPCLGECCSTGACSCDVVFGVINRTWTPEDCVGYLFFDDLHPTTAANEIIAQVLYQECGLGPPARRRQLADERGAAVNPRRLLFASVPDDIPLSPKPGGYCNYL